MFGSSFGISDQETLAMLEDMVTRANLAMVEALNIVALRVQEASLQEVPRSEDHKIRLGEEVALSDSSLVEEATPEKLESAVVYNSRYAAAQEVGHMEYVNKSGTGVHWQVEQYTTSGTKAHYLEDSGKMVLATGGEELAMQGRLMFEGAAPQL